MFIGMTSAFLAGSYQGDKTQGQQSVRLEMVLLLSCYYQIDWRWLLCYLAVTRCWTHDGGSVILSVPSSEPKWLAYPYLGILKCTWSLQHSNLVQKQAIIILQYSGWLMSKDAAWISKHEGLNPLVTSQYCYSGVAEYTYLTVHPVTSHYDSWIVCKTVVSHI